MRQELQPIADKTRDLYANRDVDLPLAFVPWSTHWMRMDRQIVPHSIHSGEIPTPILDVHRFSPSRKVDTAKPPTSSHAVVYQPLADGTMIMVLGQDANRTAMKLPSDLIPKDEMAIDTLFRVMKSQLGLRPDRFGHLGYITRQDNAGDRHGVVYAVPLTGSTMVQDGPTPNQLHLVHVRSLEEAGRLDPVLPDIVRQIANVSLPNYTRPDYDREMAPIYASAAEALFRG